MAEPIYITDLKSKFDVLGLSITDKFARIETTLGALPEIEGHLERLNGRIEKHEVDIALTKQIQERCPWVGMAPSDLKSQIKNDVGAVNGFSLDLSKRSHRFAVGGGIMALLLVFLGDVFFVAETLAPLVKSLLPLAQK